MKYKEIFAIISVDYIVCENVTTNSYYLKSMNIQSSILADQMFMLEIGERYGNLHIIPHKLISKEYKSVALNANNINTEIDKYLALCNTVCKHNYDYLHPMFRVGCAESYIISDYLKSIGFTSKYNNQIGLKNDYELYEFDSIVLYIPNMRNKNIMTNIYMDSRCGTFTIEHDTTINDIITKINDILFSDIAFIHAKYYRLMSQINFSGGVSNEIIVDSSNKCESKLSIDDQINKLEKAIELLKQIQTC